MSDNDPTDCPTDGPLPTLCDGDTTNNYWVEDGVCMLDTMTPSQVTDILQRNPKARVDLKRVTTCEDLHNLVDQVPMFSTVQEDDQLQKTFHENTALPFYTLFRGNLNNQ
jgi:hypothetical protein